MTMTARPRPFGVVFLYVLIILVGLVEIATGIILLATRGDENIHIELSDTPTSNVTVLGIIAIVIGLIDLAIAFGLRSGAEWARAVVFIVAFARAIVLVWSVIAHHGFHWDQTLLPLAVYILVAWYLYGDKDAKQFFDGTPARV
ncbi:MAG: DUF7144 family membrane protein [Ilumatobacteraceae bacterium]